MIEFIKQQRRNDQKQHYCPSCWGKNLKYPVLYEFDAWVCTNRNCPNSEHLMGKKMSTNKNLEWHITHNSTRRLHLVLVFAGWRYVVCKSFS
jgi:hypothetical protein